MFVAFFGKESVFRNTLSGKKSVFRASGAQKVFFYKKTTFLPGSVLSPKKGCLHNVCMWRGCGVDLPAKKTPCVDV